MVRLEVAILLQMCYLCTADVCQAVRYIFGEALLLTEKAVFHHKVGFSQDPLRDREFGFGSDCFCENIACYRRQSEYCIEPSSKDDPFTQTWKSYVQMNPYTKYIGVVFVMDLPPDITIVRLGLLVRTCYPYVTVFCMFRGNATWFPWMRECCDAVVLPSNKIPLNETQVLFSQESEDMRDETTIFTITDMSLNCNKCGMAANLKEPKFNEPRSYIDKQSHPEGKNLSIVVRNRHAYLTLEETNEPFKVKITGGFEPILVRDIAAAMNFSYYYIGNRTTLTTGGGINSNGTFDGMLDLLMKRTAIVSLSNQKPIHPGDELFTYTNCYDVDIMPFASRIDLFPVTMNNLFNSFGNNAILLVGLSTLAVSLTSYLLLRIRSFQFEIFTTILWFYSLRLFNSGFTLRLMMKPKLPDRLRGLVALWAFKGLIFAALFSAVWVTFIATPSLKGIIDTFDDMMAFIVKSNSTCFMSSGLVSAGYVYGEVAKPIFQRAKGTSDAKMIIHELRTAKNHPFWFYERMFIVYQLNKFGAGNDIHISRGSFIMQPQCWIIQKNCALQRHLSVYLSHYLESGLMLHLQRVSNVSDLPSRHVENTFNPVMVHQLEELFVFAGIGPAFVVLVLVCEIVIGRCLVSRNKQDAASCRNVDRCDERTVYHDMGHFDSHLDQSKRVSHIMDSEYAEKLKRRKRFDHPDFNYY